MHKHSHIQALANTSIRSKTSVFTHAYNRKLQKHPQIPTGTELQVMTIFYHTVTIDTSITVLLFYCYIAALTSDYKSCCWGCWHKHQVAATGQVFLYTKTFISAPLTRQKNTSESGHLLQDCVLGGGLWLQDWRLTSGCRLRDAEESRALSGWLLNLDGREFYMCLNSITLVIVHKGFLWGG